LVWEIALPVAFVLGVPAVPHLWPRRPRFGVPATIRAAAKELGTSWAPGEERVVGGRHGGAHVSVWWMHVPGGRHSLDKRLTMVMGGVPRTPAGSLDLEINEQSLRWNFHLTRGRAIDVITGDQKFDRQYLIEGGPSDLVRTLLNAETRQRIFALRPRHLRVKNGWVTIYFHRWMNSADKVRDAITLASYFAVSPRAIEGASDKSLELAQGGPYRQEIDVTELREMRAERLRELEALAAVRNDRQVFVDRVEMWTAGIAVALFVLLILYNGFWEIFRYAFLD
jgi:hypothetical protein